MKIANITLNGYENKGGSFMEEKILTIAVPSYNMEKYLNKCLDSFLVEEILDDLEIIIINDGSKDNTLNIAREYEQKYPHVFKVIDKENGGHGSGINYGVKYATSKYFKLIDADDWVNSADMPAYIKLLKDNQNVDMFITNFNYVYETDCKEVEADVLNDAKCLNKEIDFYKYNFKPMHSLTYKTEILKNFKFSEKCFYEDTEYAIFPLLYVEKILFSDLNIYQYRLGRSGQSVSLEGFCKHRKDHLKVNKNLILFYNENKNKLSQDERDYIRNRIISFTEMSYKIYVFNTFKDKSIKLELIDFDNWLKENNVEIYNEAGLNTKVNYVKAFRKNQRCLLKLYRLMYKIRASFRRK